MGCGTSSEEGKEQPSIVNLPHNRDKEIRTDVAAAPAEEPDRPTAELKPLNFKLDGPPPATFGEGLQCLQEVGACLEPGIASHRQKKMMAFFDNSREAIKLIACATLPPPGGQVVCAAVEIAHAAISAVFNNEDCCQLAKRMADVVHLVWLHNEELQSKKRLNLALERLQETQYRVLLHVKRFSSKGFLQRAAQNGGDKNKFVELTGEITEVISLLQVAVQLQTLTDVTGLKATLDELAKTTLTYQNRDQAMLDELDALGGPDALMQPGMEEARKRFMAKVNPDDQMMMAMMRQEFSLAQAEREGGPHVIIEHPELKLLWKMHFGKVEALMWTTFWNFFPEKLPNLPAEDRDMLTGLFEDPANRDAFRQEVDSDEQPHTVSVDELRRAFPKKTAALPELVKRVQDIVTLGHKKRAVLGAAVATTKGGATLITEVPPNKLPSSSVKLFGRDVAMNMLKWKLEAGSSQSHLSLVTGGPGVGTTAFAIAVGQALYARGALKGGAYYVNLAGCASMEQVVDSILVVINGQNASRGTEALRACLDRVRDRLEPALIILDHCDEVLVKHESEVEALLRLMMVEVMPKLMVIMCTKRVVTLDVDVATTPAVQLTKLGANDAIDMLRSITQDRLEADEAKAFAKKCGHLPMLLRLVGVQLQRAFAHQVKHVQDREVAKLVDASIADFIVAAEGGVLKSTIKSIMHALSTLNAKQRRQALELSLFPGTFNVERAQQLLSLRDPVSEEEVEDLLSALVTCCLATLENSADDEFRLQALARGQFRQILNHPARIEEHGLVVDEVLAVRKHYVKLTAEYVALHTSWSQHSPRSSYNALMLNTANVAEVLQLPKRHADVAEACLDTCVGMLLLLPYNDVYEKAVIRSACGAYAKLCAKVGDVWAEAACVAVSAIFREANQAAWTAALEQVTHVRGRLPEAADAAQRLTLALLWRAEGLVLRDIGSDSDISKSVAAFKTALEIGGDAFESCDTGRMDRIINLAELTGTLDYLGDTVLEEGLKYGQQAVQAAEEFLGSDTRHPLLALCLTAHGYFLKMAKQYEECVEANERARAMREDVYGSIHTQVAISLNQKALSLVALGRYGEANECNEQSLKIRIKCVGQEDVLVANTYHNMGDALRLQGPERAADAVDAYRHALRIKLKALKENSSNVAKTRKALASLLREQDNEAEAVRIEGVKVAAKV